MRRATTSTSFAGTDFAMPDYPVYQCSYLPGAKNLADLQSIRADMQFVVDTLSKLLRAQDDQVLRCALFSAALITYRRCFTSGVRKGLKRADVPKEAVELHKYLMDQANKLIAHSVNPFEQMKAGVVVSDQQQVVGVAALRSQLMGFDEEHIKQWGSLVMLIGNAVLSPRIKAAQDALLSVAKATPIERITKAPILSITAAGPDEAGKQRD
jgi:hypothetical protein